LANRHLGYLSSDYSDCDENVDVTDRAGNDLEFPDEQTVADT
jgi:hypothetical protein